MVDVDPSRRPSSSTIGNIGVHNETDRLRFATTWGPVGAEAVLVQLLPIDTSLFLKEGMDVEKARKEGLAYSDYLRSQGVEVFHARDILARVLPQDSIDRNAVINGLMQQTRLFQNQYGLDPRFNGRSALDVAMDLLDQDIARYGEGEALALNSALALNPETPMGNTVFARDQMNVVLKTRFVSRMAKPNRRPEVPLYEKVYEEILGDHDTTEIPEGETFEGGDAYVHKGIVYVGIGARTSPGAALFMYTHLRPQLEAQNLRFAVVEDPERRDTAVFLHLDTFSNPIGPEQVVVCTSEATRRAVGFVRTDTDGNVGIEYTGDNFIEHLEREGNDVIEISETEQALFGCNFLTVDANRITFPRADNDTTADRLQAAGKIVDVIDLEENTNGNGAAHCMTGQLRRE